MRMIKLETLKTMPNGTVFCTTDATGSFDYEIRILSDRFENKAGFNKTISLIPRHDICKIYNDENGLIKDKDFQTKYKKLLTPDNKYDKNQLFVVFSKKEVTKMIKTLKWALSDLEDDFDTDEVLK